MAVLAKGELIQRCDLGGRFSRCRFKKGLPQLLLMDGRPLDDERARGEN